MSPVTPATATRHATEPSPVRAILRAAAVSLLLLGGVALLAAPAQAIVIAYVEESNGRYDVCFGWVPTGHRDIWISPDGVVLFLESPQGGVNFAGAHQQCPTPHA